MRQYETIVIGHPELSEEEIENLTRRTTDLIEKHKGEIIHVEQWGSKKLAYKIKKQTTGHYMLLNYAAPSDVIPELERVLRLDDKVLKYLTVKLKDSVDVEAARKALERPAPPAGPAPEAAAEGTKVQGAEPEGEADLEPTAEAGGPEGIPGQEKGEEVLAPAADTDTAEPSLQEDTGQEAKAPETGPPDSPDREKQGGSEE